MYQRLEEELRDTQMFCYLQVHCRSLTSVMANQTYFQIIYRYVCNLIPNLFGIIFDLAFWLLLFCLIYIRKAFILIVENTAFHMPASEMQMTCIFISSLYSKRTAIVCARFRLTDKRVIPSLIFINYGTG